MAKGDPNPKTIEALIEDALVERLKTHALLVNFTEILAYPDDINTLGKAQKRSILLVRAYQDRTRQDPLQGARRDKVRELSTHTIECRYLAYDRRSNEGVALTKGYAKDALSGFQPVIDHSKYTVDGPLRHLAGGLIGRVRGSKRWDYYDAWELDLIYETRSGGYPANA